MLKLPKKSECKSSHVDEVEKTLKSIVAYQPSAESTYRFYEEIDLWLGPWGNAGYPLGYGKKYNIEFTLDGHLNSHDHPVSKAWVRNTTVNLQLAIIGYITSRIKAGSLPTLDEKSLREAAFASHPKAYLDAGLRDVAREEVESIPRIIMIPYAEFNPSNPNFKATIIQVYNVISEPGVLSWLLDLCSGVVEWPIRELEQTLGEYYNYLEWEIKKLQGYPGYFY